MITMMAWAMLTLISKILIEVFPRALVKLFRARKEKKLSVLKLKSLYIAMRGLRSRLLTNMGSHRHWLRSMLPFLKTELTTAKESAKKRPKLKSLRMWTLILWERLRLRKNWQVLTGRLESLIV